MIDIDSLDGFVWDHGNIYKNEQKHKVSHIECEEIFFNQPLIVMEDLVHSKSESRYHALGITDSGRKLFISFTVRKNLIRIISGRDQHKKERATYEQA